MNDNSRFFFVLAATGSALGIGSRWAFPYLSFQYGGWFYLAYFIALIVLGMPLLVMEFASGQFFKKNLIDTFYLRKFFGPLSWLMIFNAFILVCIYAVRLGWHIIYMFVSFGLQWKGRAEGYFYNNVLQVSGTSDFSDFSLAVFIALVISWVLIYFLIRKGFESFSKALVWMLPIGAFLLIAFLLYSLTFDNSLYGVYSIFRGSFFVVFRPDLWLFAFSLAASSLGVSFGIMHVISQKAEGFMVRSASIIVLFEMLVSIALGFVFSSMLGLLSFRQNVDIGSIIFADYPTTFSKMIEVLPFLYRPTISSILFFMLLGIFFLIGAAALSYSIASVLSKKLVTKERNAAIIVVGFGFLFGLIFIVKPGFYVMDIVTHYFHYNILIVLLLESIFFGWVMNSAKISNYINETSFLQLGKVWRAFIRYIVPIIFILLISFQIRIDWMGFKSYPWWGIWLFGIGTIVIPAVCAFLMPKKILDR